MGAKAYQQVPLSSNDFEKQCPCPEGDAEGTSRCRRKRRCDWANDEDAKIEASQLRNELLQDWQTLSQIQRLRKVDRLVQLCLCKPCKGRKVEVRDKLLAQMYEEEGGDEQTAPLRVGAVGLCADRKALVPGNAVRLTHSLYGQHAIASEPR